MDILVANAITSKVSVDPNIMPMSVRVKGTLAKGHKYGNLVYLIVSTAFTSLPRLSRHSDQSSVGVLPSKPDI